MKKIILNLTVHPSTVGQRQDGLINLSPKNTLKIKEILNVSSIEECTLDHYKYVLKEVNRIIENELFENSPYEDETLSAQIEHEKASFSVMLGSGTPSLNAFLSANIEYSVSYAFSVRTSEEVVQEDGSVRKVNIFKHQGFYTHPYTTV